MRSFLTAIAFLTRFPAGRWAAFDSIEVGRSAGWFPLIGLLLGAIYAAAAALIKTHLPAPVISTLLVLLDALVSGALHYDGLADSADGFGGGKSRDDILRIMRDHSIGSYGGMAVAICVALKITTYAALLRQTNWMVPLILTPALGRWSTLLLTGMLPYARPFASVVEEMKNGLLLWGTATVLIAVIATRSVRVLIAMAVVVAVTSLFGFYCRRRIGGITGDTVGANLELCESAVLLTFI